MNPIGISILGYKCFHNECGFSKLSNFNVIIGKNNIGKSSLVDAISFYYSRNIPSGISLFLEYEITSGMFTNFFHPRLKSESYAINKNFDSIFYVGKKIIFTVVSNFEFYKVSCSDKNLEDIFVRLFNTALFRQFIDFMEGSPGKTSVIRLAADRDITAESQNFMNSFLENGSQATQFVHNVLNNKRLDSSLVQQTVVNAFNEIMSPDLIIDNISTKFDDTNGTWEINLYQGNRAIPLSQSGSGLKTVLLVLLQLHVLPKIINNGGGQVYIFEELENNLHPFTQRKLLNYIYKHSIATNSQIFCTTHSNITIDLLIKKEDTSLFLLKKTDEIHTLSIVNDHNSVSEVFDELEVKASDLIQANAVIWVEGPSDRVYINKWLSLISHDLVEGEHYQYFYYGGNLLSHYKGNEEASQNKIEILKINRNSIIWIDSDKKSKYAKLRDYKTRIEQECLKNNLQCHITRFREIENYIPVSTFRQYYKSEDLSPLGEYEDIKDYLNRIKPKEGDRFEYNKVKYAKQFSEYISLYDLKKNTVLYNVVNQMAHNIRKWNSL